MTRLEALNKRGEEPLVPPNPAPYLVEWLFEIGPTIATMGGEGRLGWRDLAAWQEISGVELMPWEGRLLRRLSGDYADERYEARAQDRVAPYTGTDDELKDRREMVARKVQAAFAGLKKKEG